MCKDPARTALTLSDEKPEVCLDAEPEVHSDTEPEVHSDAEPEVRSDAEPEVLTPPTLVITSGEGGRKQCDFEDISA